MDERNPFEVAGDALHETVAEQAVSWKGQEAMLIDFLAAVGLFAVTRADWVMNQLCNFEAFKEFPVTNPDVQRMVHFVTAVQVAKYAMGSGPEHHMSKEYLELLTNLRVEESEGDRAMLKFAQRIALGEMLKEMIKPDDPDEEEGNA